MLLRLLVVLLAAALLTGCNSSPKKMSAKDVERVLEGKSGPNVVCMQGTDGWDYTCKTVHRKIGVKVYDNGTAELSDWTPVEEPLTVGPGGETPDVRARFVDEANGVCEQTNSMIARLTPPVSRKDAVSRLDQVRELRFTEVAELGAIKPPAVLLPDYTSLVAAIKAVGDEEMAIGDALVSGTREARRAAFAERRHAAQLARKIALRLGLRGCADPAVPIRGIVR